MARYDLMHWSVRVRDQQAVNARSVNTVIPAPVAAPPAARGTSETAA